MKLTEKQFLKIFPGHSLHFNDLRITQDHFETSLHFWDCDCEKNYIHNKKEKLDCDKCGSREEDMPDSRINEILLHQEHVNLLTI